MNKTQNKINKLMIITSFSLLGAGNRTDQVLGYIKKEGGIPVEIKDTRPELLLSRAGQPLASHVANTTTTTNVTPQLAIKDATPNVLREMADKSTGETRRTLVNSEISRITKDIEDKKLERDTLATKIQESVDETREKDASALQQTTSQIDKLNAEIAQKLQELSEKTEKKAAEEKAAAEKVAAEKVAEEEKVAAKEKAAKTKVAAEEKAAKEKLSLFSSTTNMYVLFQNSSPAKDKKTTKPTSFLSQLSMLVSSEDFQSKLQKAVILLAITASTIALLKLFTYTSNILFTSMFNMLYVTTSFGILTAAYSFATFMIFSAIKDIYCDDMKRTKQIFTMAENRFNQIFLPTNSA